MKQTRRYSRTVARQDLSAKLLPHQGEAAVPFSSKDRLTGRQKKEVTAYETISKIGEEGSSHTDSHSKAQTILVAPKPHLPGTADNAYTVPLLLTWQDQYLLDVSTYLQQK